MNEAKTLTAVPARDGAGVNINRIAGEQLHALLDPFLMLDEICSSEGDDYMAGFPSHPHRGFETITYLLDGRMRHRDHMGHDSFLESGGVQWMTAGRGVVHSEMPEQTEGLFRGFQIWLNLPANQKMIEPGYFDLTAQQIPVLEHGSVLVKLISGVVSLNGKELGASGNLRQGRAVVADVHLQPGAQAALALPEGHKLLVYIYDGDAVGVQRGQMAISTVGQFSLVAGRSGCNALVLGGIPLNEPVIQYGPFVMNTHEQIAQALRDYSNGKFNA
jgi:redox-sensitive bicupin YhaK (pirin superfamily)